MRTEEGLILFSEEGNVLWANDEAANLLGYSQNEINQLAMSMTGVDGGSPIGPVASAFGTLLNGKALKADGHARFPKKDNKRVAVHWKLWLLPPAQGRKQILLAISETAQASAESVIVSGYRDVFEYVASKPDAASQPSKR